MGKRKSPCGRSGSSGGGRIYQPRDEWFPSVPKGISGGSQTLTRPQNTGCTRSGGDSVGCAGATGPVPTKPATGPPATGPVPTKPATGPVPDATGSAINPAWNNVACGGGSVDDGTTWTGHMVDGVCVPSSAQPCYGWVDIPGTNINYGWEGEVVENGLCQRTYDTDHNPWLHGLEADGGDDWHMNTRDLQSGGGGLIDVAIETGGAISSIVQAGTLPGGLVDNTIASIGAVGGALAGLFSAPPRESDAMTRSLTMSKMPTEKQIKALVDVVKLKRLKGVAFDIAEEMTRVLPPPEKILVCDGRIEIPSGHSVRWDPKQGTMIRDNQGIEVSHQYYCDNPVCVYSNTEYTGDLSILGDGSNLKRVLEEEGIGVVTLDSSVCDHDKVRILLDIIKKLDGFTDMIDVVDDYIPAWLANLNPVPIDKLDGILGLSKASIQFGMGDMGDSVISVLESFPGSGKFIEILLEKAGLTEVMIEKLNDIPLEWKERLKNAQPLATSAITIAFPAAAPFVAVIDALVLFGRKMWDEALETLLSLGMGKFFQIIFGPLKAAFSKKP